MSRVHFQFRQPDPGDPSGLEVVDAEVVEITPLRRRIDGQVVVLPRTVPVRLEQGEAIVELAATGPSECWQAVEPDTGKTRYFLVPDVDGVLEYTELPDVDPNTLEPSPEALAGWTATLNEVRELRNDAVAVIPLLEPIPGIASAVHADAEAADAAAGQAGVQATQAGQHRQAVEQVVTGVLPGIEAAKADAVQTVEQTGAGVLSEMSGLRDTMVVGGEVAGDVLRLTRADGSTVDAGAVRGQAGADGVSATLELSAQTGEPGTEVVVDNLGTPQAANYRLTIPRGATGSAAPWMRLAAGRPDTPGTLDPDTLAWRNAAPSGSTFYSSDGPEGAWAWRKRGATWVCVEGDTGWVKENTLDIDIKGFWAYTALRAGYLRRRPGRVDVWLGNGGGGPLNVRQDYSGNGVVPSWARPDQYTAMSGTPRNPTITAIMATPSGGFSITGNWVGYTSTAVSWLVDDALPWPSASDLWFAGVLPAATTIGRDVFSGYKRLAITTLPSGVTDIGQSAFSGCTGLVNLELPATVTSIGVSAFAYCSALVALTVLATTPPTLGASALPSSAQIYVPAASVDAYKTAAGWSGYASRIHAIA